MSNKVPDWDDHNFGNMRRPLKEAIEDLLNKPQIKKVVSDKHILGTPDRYVKAMYELLSGCHTSPEEVLGSGVFEENTYDEMVVVKDIHFVSLCAHHLLPFIGKVHFGYIPNKKLVGLSKIARLVEVLSRRPQIQEHLSHQIVETFEEVINPRGCGVVIEASHMCMTIRGVRKPGALTSTSAVRGVFKNYEATKAEFLDRIR